MEILAYLEGATYKLNRYLWKFNRLALINLQVNFPMMFWGYFNFKGPLMLMCFFELGAPHFTGVKTFVCPLLWSWGPGIKAKRKGPLTGETEKAGTGAMLGASLSIKLSHARLMTLAAGTTVGVLKGMDSAKGKEESPDTGQAEPGWGEALGCQGG